MNKKPTIQDDSREQKTAEMFNLDRDGGRIGTDATDENKNLYELKTTTRRSVSTARDFGLNHIARWRQHYFIIQTWETVNKVLVPTKSYFLAPEHMEEWYAKIEKKLNHSIKLIETTKKLLEATGAMSDKNLAEVIRLLDRGKLLNDPHISLSYIRKHGIEIENHCPKKLRELVKQFPIKKK